MIHLRVIRQGIIDADRTETDQLLGEQFGQQGGAVFGLHADGRMGPSGHLDRHVAVGIRRAIERRQALAHMHPYARELQRHATPCTDHRRVAKGGVGIAELKLQSKHHLAMNQPGNTADGTPNAFHHRLHTFVAGGEQSFSQDRHGTAVAGIIAARANNQIGIVGIAPEADILALKACWQRASASRQALCSSWTLAKAVDFAILAGAQVLNFSLAGPPDPLLARLLGRAAAQGITVVAAARESASGPGFPAALDTVIAVISSDATGQVRLPANVMHPPPLIAPGIEILTTVPRRAYDFVSGSSLAAAHVSGIVALLLEWQPTLSPARLHTLLQSTARPVHAPAGTSRTTVGFVDACAALRKLGHIPTCMPLAGIP